MKLVKIPEGVYEILLDINTIRLIVLSRIPESPENALWQLFSGKAEKFVYGDKHYNWHYDKQQSVLNSLYELYKIEEISMSYTWNDFERDYTRKHLHLLSSEERLRDMPTAERLRDIPTAERLRDIPIAERLRDIPTEELLKVIPKKLLEKYLSKKSD